MLITESFDIAGDHYSAEEIIQAISPLLSEERKNRIESVVANRTKNLTVVMDSLCDEGNMSAIIRSCESYGVQTIHSILNKRKVKVTARTTQGCHKWVDLPVYREHAECLKALKQQGMQIIATNLSEDAVHYREVDFTRPTAIIVGNEHAGTHGDVLDYADVNCIIPTVGFTQSFNVSVASSILLAEAWHQRIQKFGKNGDLSTQEKVWLMARYYLSSVKFNKGQFKLMKHFMNLAHQNPHRPS